MVELKYPCLLPHEVLVQIVQSGDFPMESLTVLESGSGLGGKKLKEQVRARFQLFQPKCDRTGSLSGPASQSQFASDGGGVAG